MLRSEEIEERDICDFYELTVEDLRRVDIQSWWTEFGSLSIESRLFQIPQNALTYLRSSGPLFLPPHSETSGLPSLNANAIVNGHDDDDEDSWSSSSSEEEGSEGSGLVNGQGNTAGIAVDRTVNFEVFENELKGAIRQLGGSVFPKLNWKSPKDARWIAFNNSLESKYPGDIYLVIKSSFHTSEILEHPFKWALDSSDENPEFTYKLILRKWRDVRPETEFRGFVCNSKLIAISQRDSTTGWPSIGDNRDQIIKDVHNFYKQHLHKKFALDFYVFDLIREDNGQIILVDFNPFGLSTDPVLFSYKEMKTFIDDASNKNSELEGNLEYGDPYFRFLSPRGPFFPHEVARNAITHTLSLSQQLQNNLNLNTS